MLATEKKVTKQKLLFNLRRFAHCACRRAGWNKSASKGALAAGFDLLVASDIFLMSPPSLSVLCLISPSFHPPLHLRICVFDSPQAKFPHAKIILKYITLFLWLSQGCLEPSKKRCASKKEIVTSRTYFLLFTWAGLHVLSARRQDSRPVVETVVDGIFPLMDKSVMSRWCVKHAIWRVRFHTLFHPSGEEKGDLYIPKEEGISLE